MIHSRVRCPRPQRRGGWCLAIAGLVLALVTVVDAAPAFGPKEYIVEPALPLPRSGGFPACQPERGGQLGWKVVQTVMPGHAGRLVLNQRETVLVLEGPSQRRVVERAVQLAASNTLLVWMIGPPGATLAVSVTSAGACLDVAITSPAPGASVQEGPFLVRGTATPRLKLGSASTAFPPWFTGGSGPSRFLWIRPCSS